MKRKIYTTLFTFACAVLTLTSCSDWLTLYPQDEIKEEYLFSTGDGFRTATNGIYRKMSTFNMYGSNLTWGLVDAWAQMYYIYKAPVSGGGKAMQKISSLEFKDIELVPTTNSLWTSAWNVVANCNELAQQVAKADPSIFYGLDLEKKMILGEAIGLRAFVQFDLLRIYAPSKWMNPGNRTFIPYVNVYPSYINNHQTVDYCLDKIIADLKESQRILEEVDKDVNLGSSSRYETSISSTNGFMGARGYRLNYFAVTAELARVYLYAGMMDEAYQEAKKIIDFNNKYGYFTAETKSDGFKEGNMKMYADVIFALFSPTELVEWDQKINHDSDGKENEYYLCVHKDLIDEIYGENDKKEDFRFKYQLEEKHGGTAGYLYRTLKYYKQVGSYMIAQRNNSLIPMIRMSEVYYIAAEAIYDKDPNLALDYLKRVKLGRGLKKFDVTNIKTKNDFIAALMNDARREFLGEGQMFYMYKRLGKTMPSGDPTVADILPKEENMVLPLPDSETTI